jgi:putative oxidoreductase
VACCRRSPPGGAAVDLARIVPFPPEAHAAAAENVMRRLFATTTETAASVALLVLRLGLGALMISGHGWGKLAHFAERAQRFSDPLGLGSPASLALATFAEVFCSAALMLGLATRLAVIPLIVTMTVAFTVVHRHDPWGKRELPLMYLTPYVALLVAGPGRFSVDGSLAGRLSASSRPSPRPSRPSPSS